MQPGSAILSARRPIAPADTDAIELTVQSGSTLRQFYSHVLNNHRLAEPATEESYQCTKRGYLAVAFYIELDAEDAPPIKAELVISTRYEQSLRHRKGVEVYRVHILDIGKFADEKLLAALRPVLSDALQRDHILIPQHLIATMEAPQRT